MQGITKNDFSGGRNTDLDPSKIGIDQYLEAYNLELVGDGKFLALQNIKGTTKVQEITVGVTDTLAVFENRYLIGSSLYNCLTIFTVTGSTLKIWCYNTETDTTYEIFQETTSGYDAKVVDAVNYPESGTDVVYFTDFFNEVRSFKCEIPSPYTANFLSAYDISLLRKGANGTIVLSTVTTGGTLLSGTYQFSYRMVNPTSKKFTKWSTLTNPIHVYNKGNDNDPVYSGIGMSTPRKITLSITPSTEETDEYDFIQLAVVENVGPTVQDINGVTTALPLTASLLEITAIPTTSLTFNYTSNSKIGSIPIEDITVDLAQIEKVKTLNVKENRLFLGNIVYTDLEFDNGTPTVTSGQSIKAGNTGVRDTFSSDENASRYIGYWRDEVYRFGIVYTDKNGNKSSVQPLDLTNKITGNTISGAPDVKFPDRSYSPTYSIFNTGSEETSPLGLRLTGIVNHPTWARSFEIVRVKRIKNILFQSPLIPMSSVSGIGATSEYPTIYYNGIKDTTVTDAQPQTVGSVLVPKNLFWPELRNIVQNGQPIVNNVPGPFGGIPSPTTFRSPTEVKLQRASSYSFGAIFPSPNMYGDTPFQYTGVEKIDVVDFALLKVNYLPYTNSNIPITYNTGDYVKTSVVGNFYAVNAAQYYFDPYSVKSLPSSYKNIPLTNYEFFDNYGEPASVGGNSTLDYEALQTKGIGFWQNKPTTQKMAVVQIGTTLPEGGISFLAGNLNSAGNGNFIMGSSGPTYEGSTTLTNKYVTAYSSFTNQSSYVSAVPIVNVKLGLGDTRYGDINAQHEYISTGAKYTFTTSEIATLEAGGTVSKNIDVFGGDCMITSQLFKVCDSTYSVVNQSKNIGTPEPRSTTVAKWDSVYLYDVSGDDPVICLPVAVQNSGQYVQVILESEYNGEVRDFDTIQTNNTSEGGFPIYINTTEASIRTPLSYKYNLNLSKQNAQKVYFPKQLYSFEQNDFGSRIAYSDLKIYNSDQAGFDIFRVGNVYDLEESRHNITKLAVGGDALYAIQEQGIVYIPTGERQLEATDAGQLAVRSGDVIGRPMVIDSVRGSQHLRGIVETGGVIYIPDNINKSIYALSGQELKPIIQNNETLFRDFFENELPEKNVIGIYDPVRREYWIADNLNNSCQVYNEQIGWVSNYEFNKLFGGVFTNQNLYLIGYNSGDGDTSVYSMYTGTVNNLFGRTVVPRVKFSVNPSEGFSKTFDSLMFDAGQRLSTVDFEVERESSLGNQTITGTSLNIESVEGNFRLKSPRDATNARLRGLRMLTTVKWSAVQSALKAVYTKFRMSSRTPW